MSRHALPWTITARYRDMTARLTPGRHARNLSSTHVPAWPFRRNA